MNREQMKFLLNSPLTSREKLLIMAVAEGFTLDPSDDELKSILGVGYRQILIDVGNLVRFGLITYKRWNKRWTINLTRDFEQRLCNLQQTRKDMNNDSQECSEAGCKDMNETRNFKEHLPLLPPLKLNIDTNRYRSIDIETHKGDKSNRGVGEEREEPEDVQTTTPSSPGVDSPPPPSSAPPPSPKKDDFDEYCVEGGFQRFWAAYPRKTQKVVARKRWSKVCSSYKDFVTIMDGLDRAREYWAVHHTKFEHIPHPATWLNQERWNDNYELDDFRSTPSANQFSGWGIKPKQLPPDDIGW